MNSTATTRKRPREEDGEESFSGEEESDLLMQPRQPSVNTPCPTNATVPPLNLSSHRRGSTNDRPKSDDDDDDEIEFLFSLRPEPQSIIGRKDVITNDDHDHDDDETKLAATSRTANMNDTAAMMDATTTFRSNTESIHVTPASKSGRMIKPTVTNTSTHTTTTSNPSTTSLFSHRSSAYLQSLAEICHAILWDARWRVGGGANKPLERLFCWERGEDLSALLYLSRRYNSIIQQPHHPEKKQKSEEEHNQEASNTQNIIDTNDSSDQEDDDLDRCLETYSRLYFRKGPWFRLDNIFSSYYIPKKKEKAPTGEEDTLSRKDKQPSPLLTKPMSPSKFFLPTSHQAKRRKSVVATEQDMDQYIDQEQINQQLEAVLIMLKDIQQLSYMGLIRFFCNEEECGKTVGANEKYQMAPSCLLRQDEQRSVLAKLGGQKRRRPSPTTTAAAAANGTNGGAKLSFQSDTSENLIWKQMCQQQPIFQSFARKSNQASSNVVLPVARHVHQVLIEKWASVIVLKSSKVDYVPPAMLGRVTAAVAQRLNEWTSDLDVGPPVLTMMCLRLRESPLQTLRRACRLYLCATSGPGDMRGDGTNAWRSLPDQFPQIDLRNLPLRTNNVPPPGSNSWHMVTYPGKDWRMRLLGCNFIRSHKPMLLENDSVDEGSLDSKIQVFASVSSFHSWETGVELRAMGDFLLELNDLHLYIQRKQAREKDAQKKRDGATKRKEGISDDESVHSKTKEGLKEIDFLQLLNEAGRRNVIDKLFDGTSDTESLLRQIEQNVCCLLENDLPKSNSNDLTDASTNCPLQNDAEKVLGVTAVLLIHVLEHQNYVKPTEETVCIILRPWLRHLCWEGCMAYLLWDMIPILERRGCYDVAINALEVLLFGKRLHRGSNSIPKTLRMENGSQTGESMLANCYLSRRARGKAYERLIIDYIHVVRRNSSPLRTAKGKTKAKDEKKKRESTRTKKEHEQKPSAQPSAADIVNFLTQPLLQSDASTTGRITFAAIRTLARRLKQPLSATLRNMKLYETSELGHRLSSISSDEECPAKYSDWRPVTDTTVANAMANDNEGAGCRCAYVGFEEDEQNSVYVGSLNVEQLAMEYYSQGRLPKEESQTSESPSSKGGWKGYHDEGGSIRALFRILSYQPLGMDFVSTATEERDYLDVMTIHLTPYQGAPFDLHVGAELMADRCAGFYQRQQDVIDPFLQRLSCLDASGIADEVYDSIKRRLDHACSTKHTDPTLERDISQVRTLSMLAAGFGGKMLALVFRCMFFDYRHYSGGLPDLTLFRARFTNSSELVDLGEWVGEKFSSEYQASLRAEQAAMILNDRDEEFLGCSKVGDSGGRSTNRFNQSSRRSFGPSQSTKDSSEDVSNKLNMPDRLRMEHDERPVQVECMCVEVKSQNDRLDPRQEDWLNILSLHGNARVCKFEKPKKPKAKKKQKQEDLTKKETSPTEVNT